MAKSERLLSSLKFGKGKRNANPISSNVFCADPTAVEYDGRLYVYGTNDHQQYDGVGPDGKNTYEQIKSFVCFSTDDMVNWTYHGTINVGEIAPWIIASWAPSIVSREEPDGLTHFYLYFSNSGAGVGVLTATSPLGPWSDPLHQSLIYFNTPGLGDCPNPFDPGALIDPNGKGFLVFGGGRAKNGTSFMPGSARIVALGDDMLSFASDFVEMPAAYFFEASELNFVNGEYVYTYNMSWEPRNEWPFDGYERAPQCSMVYMTSKTPLDKDSWVYRGHYFINPGEAGMEYSNNHTHFLKFRGKYYILYHTLILQKKLGTEGGFRSLCVDTLDVDEDTLEITARGGTVKGVEASQPFSPYRRTLGATMRCAAEIDWLPPEEEGDVTVPFSTNIGSWVMLSDVDFGDGAKSFKATVMGNGTLELRLDGPDNDTLVSIPFKSSKWTQIEAELPEGFNGKHYLYFLFSKKRMFLRDWEFSN